MNYKENQLIDQNFTSSLYYFNEKNKKSIFAKLSCAIYDFFLKNFRISDVETIEPFLMIFKQCLLHN